MKRASLLLIACAVLGLTALPLSAEPAASAAPAGIPSVAPAPAPTTMPSTLPSTRPATVADIPAAIEKGVAYLVHSQNKDGSWGTGTETRGFEVMAMVPGSHDGFRLATTALCVMALREAGEKAAHDKGVEYLVTHADARRDDGMLLYNTWGHIYALQALSIEMRHGGVDPRLKTAAAHQVERLVQYETYTGGWNYYDFAAQTEQPSMGPTSFGTAAGLVALWEAKQAGVEVPQKLIDRSLRRLGEMQMPNGAYLYSHDLKYIPRLPANQLRGSVGRTQSANFALWLWQSDKVDEPKVRQGLEMFFREHDFIQMGRKRPLPHESWYQTAPYYYYFGHYYTARLIEKLDSSARRDFGARLAVEEILPYQEPDGAWWDFAMWDYHKPYGTAFAVMTLLRCQP